MKKTKNAKTEKFDSASKEIKKVTEPIKKDEEIIVKSFDKVLNLNAKNLHNSASSEKINEKMKPFSEKEIKVTQNITNAKQKDIPKHYPGIDSYDHENVNIEQHSKIRKKSDNEIIQNISEIHKKERKNEFSTKIAKVEKTNELPIKKKIGPTKEKSEKTIITNEIIAKTIVSDKMHIPHHKQDEENESTYYHDPLEIEKIISFQEKCPFSTKSESEKFTELINYIKQKQIQIIPMGSVKNEGKILGEGGFGVVYEGEWDNCKVAIKEMFISYDEFKVMDSELNFMGQFRNPRLITLFGIYIKEIRANKLQCGFIMELMKKDLETYLYNDPKADKSLKKKIKIAKEIISAINYLHKVGVVHRDIKPKNILLDEYDQVKLTDLGIAKVLENKEKTESATIAFTARYASREAAIESVTCLNNDVWSFGMLLYEILTEKKPWGNNLNNAKILIFLNNLENPFEKDWEKNFDKFLYDLVLACSNYNYKERPSSEHIMNCLNEYFKKIP